jgi:hypothetical protein
MDSINPTAKKKAGINLAAAQGNLYKTLDSLKRFMIYPLFAFQRFQHHLCAITHNMIILSSIFWGFSLAGSRQEIVAPNRAAANDNVSP